jgi:hypothetical protein
MKEILPTDLTNTELQTIRMAPEHGALTIYDGPALTKLRALGLVTPYQDPPMLTDSGRHLKWTISMGRQVP